MTPRATILTATIEALRGLGRPASAKELVEAIQQRSLYEFHAKDPSAVLRAAIRKHLRVEGENGRIRAVGRDQYALNG